ncbi:YkoP family protein [Deinococcus sp.]|uniref:YkoP family protein n=1 Tax=Deinococcus sp. TaxID=47478 RepID=UPI003CC509FF
MLRFRSLSVAQRLLLEGLLAAGLWSLLPPLLQGRWQIGVLREGQGGSSQVGLLLSAGRWLRQPEALQRAVEGTRLSLLIRAGEAARFPAAVQALSEDGHEWVLLATPGALAAQRSVLERLSEQPPRLTVPLGGYWPWTLPLLRRAGMQALGGGRSGPLQTLLDGAEPGSILALDALDAEQLSQLLATLRAREYRPGPVGALEGLRSETLRGLLQRGYRRIFDAGFDRRHAILPLTQRARGLFRVSRQAYSGPALQGNPNYSPGMPAAELHIHSKRLVALAERSALTGLRAVQTSLYDVAKVLAEHPDYQDAQLIYALTIFAEVLTPLGFHSQPLNNPRTARVMAFFMNLLRVLYGAKNTDRRVILPQIIWMTRAELLERYQRPARRKPPTEL